MKKVVKLTESDLIRIIKKVINEGGLFGNKKTSEPTRKTQVQWDEEVKKGVQETPDGFYVCTSKGISPDMSMAQKTAPSPCNSSIIKKYIEKHKLDNKINNSSVTINNTQIVDNAAFKENTTFYYYVTIKVNKSDIK